jgi:enoyl-[acyl-carrier-protein] reductase (NADH)
MLHQLVSNVKIISSDVTNEEEVKNIYAAICSSMPSIGGVTHGASKFDGERSDNSIEFHINPCYYSL